MTEASITIKELNRFPVKGLSADPLTFVNLVAGEGIPGDRLFGFARFNSGFDPKDPKPLPKDRFVVLLKVAGLAGLRTTFHDETQELEIRQGDNTQTFDMRDPEASTKAARHLHEALELSDPHPPTFVSSAPHRFTDVSVVSPQMMNAISVLNLNSVRDMEERIGAKIHPDRFRANVVIDGLPPYAELDAVGNVLDFGEVSFRILSRTKRCAATEVNPETAERDLKIPYLLRKELGHTDMGVYVEVVSGGTLNVGQAGGLKLP
ncbi:MOSC domain-containing protein [uncultured Tateyamaria sp.]|uniref:MOSC domain-containing protein n=1 Tax=uncultured Tateyamaria sp. TaxID=455651 RepID=UPI00263541D1|nr:MOSC domain-containing protein [uncultured Tateyamaria sp.]